jgi:hypothetical protein
MFTRLFLEGFLNKDIKLYLGFEPKSFSKLTALTIVLVRQSFHLFLLLFQFVVKI